MRKVLVTGGCGYIGSHTIVELIENGYDVISVDNLSNSGIEALDGVAKITGRRVENAETDLCDISSVDALFEANPDIWGVVHFAAFKAVSESVEHPLRYYQNNLGGLINVLRASKQTGVRHFVYSSSCTVYGEPARLPVSEDLPIRPAQSPYGWTKQMGEQIINDVLAEQDKLSGISLRYFNPAGAHPSGFLGEAPVNEALNLVPVITETAAGLREQVMVFGDDYDTRDGTCIRDYIHVMDVARAHRLALECSQKGAVERPIDVFNLGIGAGVTVMEAINAFQQVTGLALNYVIGSRRPGDVSAIYADATKASRVLDWNPEFDINDIMQTAWKWEQARRPAQSRN